MCLFAGEHYVTVSYVLPCLLSLNTHLHEMKRQSKHCKSLIDGLMTSMRRRFAGIFNKAQIIKRDTTTDVSAFSDDIYFVSAVLNPMFCLRWIDCDITDADIDTDDGIDCVRDQVRQNVKGVKL